MTTSKSIGKIVALSASMHQANRKAKAAGRGDIFYPFTKPLTVFPQQREVSPSEVGSTPIKDGNYATTDLVTAINWKAPFVLYDINKGKSEHGLPINDFVSRILVNGFYSEVKQDAQPISGSINPELIGLHITDVKIYLKSLEQVEYITGKVELCGPFSNTAQAMISMESYELTPRWLPNRIPSEPALLITWDLLPSIN